MDHLKSQDSHNAKNMSCQKQVRFLRDHDELIAPVLRSLVMDIYKHLPPTNRTLADRTRDIATIENRLRTQGLSFATKILPQLADSLFQYIETGKSDYRGFSCGEKHPRFLGQLFSLIYDPSICESNKIWAVSCIYQISYIFKKLQGPYSPNVLVKHFDDFCLVDQTIGSIDFESEPVSVILDKAREDIDNIFGKHVAWEQNFFPKPGPGSTNTFVEKDMRYEPRILYKQLDDVFWYEDYFLPSYNHWTPEARKLRLLPRSNQPTSRFKHVPKTYGKPRGICIEENEMQYLQQGVKGFLYELLETQFLTHGRINFASQQINRDLALIGSRTREWATIDMSEASDRIALLLVLSLFRNHPDWQDVFCALSTRTITAPEELKEAVRTPVLNVSKFAPMGSGLCFPVMALVHFVLVRAIIGLSSLPNRDSHLKNIYVYGDDIILPSACVEAVYDYLPLFGMKLNTQKSFYKGAFRESCGLHAYKGREITPVFIKKINLKTKRTEVLLSVLAAEYGLFTRGYTKTAKLLRSWVNKVEGNLPYVDEDSPCLGFVRRGYYDPSTFVNSGCRVRWQKCPTDPSKPYYQHYEYRVRVVVNKRQALPPMRGFSGLMRKLVTCDKDATVAYESTKDLKIQWRWMSLSAACRSKAA